MRLELDSSCTDKRAWRVELPPGAEVDVLARRLLSLGLVEQPAPPGIATVATAERTLIIMVRRTKRVQLRVDIGVERSRRRHAAEAAFALLVAAVQGHSATGARR